MATRYISVSGNIGVGKSTLAKRLSEAFGLRHYAEPVENPYFDDYYSDMTRWALHSQITFAVNFAKIHRSISLNTEPAVQERNLFECHVFANALLEQGILSNREYGTLIELVDCCLAGCQRPDLIVYLTAPTNCLLERIKSRGLNAEKSISLAYLDTLQLAYERWVASFRICPILRMDTDANNLVGDREYLRELGRCMGLA